MAEHLVDPNLETDTEGRARVKRVAIKVFVVQVLAMIALWLLNARYGTP
ncbi:MAG: hypothetical protein OXI46_04490 [Gemmatimonadota bacterium]|nr:hypothetical protein [Gemmatimonadota bacterium]